MSHYTRPAYTICYSSKLKKCQANCWPWWLADCLSSCLAGMWHVPVAYFVLWTWLALIASLWLNTGLPVPTFPAGHEALNTNKTSSIGIFMKQMSIWHFWIDCVLSVEVRLHEKLYKAFKEDFACSCSVTSIPLDTGNALEQLIGLSLVQPDYCWPVRECR